MQKKQVSDADVKFEHQMRVSYNEGQLHLLQKVLTMNDNEVLLLQGPPGTGKTKTIIGIIKLMLETEKNTKPLKI
jgi:senataxin